MATYKVNGRTIDQYCRRKKFEITVAAKDENDLFYKVNRWAEDRGVDVEEFDYEEK